MPEELAKTFDPAEVEPRIYGLWKERDCFHAPAADPRPAFSITIPPPNVTGELHMGHALQHTIHDLILRRKRMQGFNVLCLPGTDHAGIATQMKVEQALRKEGLSRWDLGRAGFTERAREWTLQYGGTILGQLQALGCSYDWSRTRFTLDEFVEEGPETADWALGRIYEQSGYARAVLHAFVHFYERGWVYRGERIVNWCPQCQTVVSDLEVEHRDLSSHLWHLRYPGTDGSEGLAVATTRPETMLGDTGVAVNPSDLRYTNLVGKNVRLPLVNREIPVVADHHVDASFGSGAVKVTPAHDPNDWDIAQRHPELMPPITVIDDAGVMTPQAGPYAGLKREEARKKVVAALQEQGLLVKVEEHQHAVGHHDKCGTVIEPLLKLQWWANCSDLAASALATIRARKVTYTPERFTQMETDWLESIRPWCVSRQLWWGHRIPLWYCLACDGEVARTSAGSLAIGEKAQPIPSVERPAACPRCAGNELEQDPDVLDTWFSSALWPFVTMGWPERTDTLATFYPTDLMITGRDILYLWVARMIMAGGEFMGREPFREVLVHATVMTEDGRRMSKSLGTGVDPLELIRLYGADATRFGLSSLVTDSQDIRFKMIWESGGKAASGPDDRLARAEQIEQMRNFCTKLWNISRFVLMNLEGEEGTLRPLSELMPRDACPLAKFEQQTADLAEGAIVADTATLEDAIPHSAFRIPQLKLADRWILSRIGAASASVNDALDRYALGEASWTLYHFVWDEFADWYVELAKPRLRSDDPETRRAVREVLLAVLETTLRLAHPFIPFISEAIWQGLPGRTEGETLATQSYPGGHAELHDEAAEASLNAVIEVTRAIRNLKSEVGAATKSVDVFIAGPAGLEMAYVEQSARCRVLDQRPEGPVSAAAVGAYEIALATAGLVDVAAEIARLTKELEKVAKDLAGLDSRLNNEQFVARAAPDAVAKARAQRDELLQRRATLGERLRAFTATGGAGQA